MNETYLIQKDGLGRKLLFLRIPDLLGVSTER